MRAGAISSAVFALSCIGTSVLSSRILGPGMWGWIILAAGVFVGSSPYVGSFAAAGRAVGLLLAVAATLAVGLGLLAATAGGRFRLPADQALLLGLFTIIAVSGFVLFRAKPDRGPT